MTELDTDSCIAAIRDGELMQASVNDGAFTVRIENYAHFVCTAIHNGHRLRPELLAKCALDDAQRLREEDPWTADVAARLTRPACLRITCRKFRRKLLWKPLQAAVRPGER